MGQKNANRVQFRAREEVHTPANDDKQLVNFTGYFRVGDIIDIYDVDEHGNAVSMYDNITIDAIDKNVSLVFDQVVDTTTATGTPMIVGQPIDDVQEAIDRLYRFPPSPDQLLEISEPIVTQELNQPVGGKTLYRVANTKLIRAGDKFDILADEGLVQADVVVDSVSSQADDANNKAYVVITTVVDTSAFTNPFLYAKDISLQDAIERNQERIDGIDAPVENEDMNDGDGQNTAFETDNLFVQGSSKVWVDDGRKKLGTAGDRAFLEEGTYPTTISINDNTGAATAKEIADALNADADAKRLIQVQYGGDGSGVVTPFSATNLASGDNNGTKDYAELEQVYRNEIVNTGYKWASFHIRTNEPNRMNKPPQDDEELIGDYRQATENIDY